MFDLYTAGTTNGLRASIMLEELGLPYRATVVDFNAALSNRPKGLLDANPAGTIPVLVDHERQVSISQSFAIMLYLCERSSRFLPQSAAGRAQVHQWMSFVMTDVISATHGLFMLAGPLKAPLPIVEQYEARLMRYLGVADHRLAQVQYLAGDEISVVDFALYPTVHFRRPLLDRNPRLTHLEGWLARVGSRAGTIRGMAVS